MSSNPDPRIKPPPGSRLRLGEHPLTAGLVLAVPFNDPGGTRLNDAEPWADLRPGRSNGERFIPGPRGWARDYTGVTGGVDGLSEHLSTGWAGPGLARQFTLAVRWMQTALPPTSCFLLGSMDASEESIFGLSRHPLGRLGVWVENVIWYFPLPSGQAMNYWHTTQVIYDGGRIHSQRIRLYLNGVRRTPLVVPETPGQLSDGYRGWRTEIWRGVGLGNLHARLEWCCAWNRALPESMVVRHAAEPYSPWSWPGAALQPVLVGHRSQVRPICRGERLGELTAMQG